MILADRIRALRDAKPPPSEDIQKQTSLFDQYLLQTEKGQFFPDIYTLEAWARALGVPLFQLFYEDGKPPVLHNLEDRLTCDEIVRRSADDSHLAASSDY